MTARTPASRELVEELADLAVAVAREAAVLVRTRARGTVVVADTKTSAIDVVTEADRATEALVRERILARRPDDAILGEEGDDVAGTTGVRWVVDPIDGTVNFLYGIPQYAVSLAAEVDGEAVAGVVVDVAKDVVYVARPGPDGATVALRDGTPISVGEPRPLGERLIGTGFSYVTDVKVVQAAAVGALLPRIRDVRRLGSCALDLCHVAEGLLDGYVEEGVNLWDHAAGGLVARAAGARTETGRGAGGLTLLLCAPSHGFDDLRAATHEAGFWAE
ncbi:inositol monophosphatase family protein [Nocardioides rubriscoriae]|uniref:inositol monophosphatase family protein n=1 Tax=Nocardioides rubriscoriae TaxID=642762 RepID=UPI0011DF72AA|nr:inositol monophosphatase family protein [Nocardioides rubriscoriae]